MALTADAQVANASALAIGPAGWNRGFGGIKSHGAPL